MNAGSTIRPCTGDDRPAILHIINAAAEAYPGVIPDDCWHDPYMPAEALDREVAAGVAFSGWQGPAGLEGVMGLQPLSDITLIRHAYVAPDQQGRGIGQDLLRHLMTASSQPMLVGTWAAATWAIRFYERNGFARVGEAEVPDLLRRKEGPLTRDLVRKEYTSGTASLTRLNEVQRDFVVAKANVVAERVALRTAWSALRAAAGEP